jgi:heme/copper-type cytochrome/quinol oxidase subunit 4
MSATERERREFEPHGEAHLPPEDQAHPGPREYVLIAIVLAVVTGLEVALFYVDFLPSTAVVTALLLLMTIKFALVVLWFMHLRFDPPVFKRLFVTGLVLALSVFLVVLLTFGAGLGPAVLAVALVLVVLGVFLARPRFLRRA